MADHRSELAGLGHVSRGSHAAAAPGPELPASAALAKRPPADRLAVARAEGPAGDSHQLWGYYAIVKKGGQDYVELVFVPDDLSFRGMLDFKEGGLRNDLQDQEEAVLGLIFLVPPGRGVVAVRSQGGRIDFGETFRMRAE